MECEEKMAVKIRDGLACEMYEYIVDSTVEDAKEYTILYKGEEIKDVSALIRLDQEKFKVFVEQQKKQNEEFQRKAKELAELQKKQKEEQEKKGE